MYDITYMQNLKNNTAESICIIETDTDIENKVMDEGWEGIKLGLTDTLLL